MFNHFQHAPMGYGPGSQPTEAEGDGMSWMPLPSGMRTYEGHVPEIEDAAAVAPALALLKSIGEACRRAAEEGTTTLLPLADLDPASRRLLAETLGEGEVSCRLEGEVELLAQEAVFAGVWTLHDSEGASIEVAPVPSALLEGAFQPRRPALGTATPEGQGVVNAPALVTELFDRSAAWRPGSESHVINLSLLPHTPQDLEHLALAIGEGAATILSRGYGNCRVAATALPNVWRVQYFNSMDALILDSFEVTEVPEVALAAPEDFADSAQRLAEVLEAVR